MNNQARHFLLKLTPYLIGIILFDLLLGLVGGRIVAHMPGNSNKLSQHKYRMDTTTADVILIGPSRCQQHYVPEQLRDSIAAYIDDTLAVYNAGIDGTGLCSNLCAIESMLDRYTPKMIVIDVTDGDFRSYHAKTVRYLMPFYSSNKHVQEYVNAISLKDRILAHSNLYRYNGRQLIEMVEAYRHPEASSGYFPNPQTMDTTHMKASPTEEVSSLTKAVDSSLATTDEKIMAHFRDVVNLCRQRDVVLIISVSPCYQSSKETSLTEQVCRRFGLPLINSFDDNHFNHHPELFRDQGHLNYLGAPVYTSLFFERLKPYLKKPAETHPVH